MPMFETSIDCPVCEKPLTDVDGMLECQNDWPDWHFVYLPGETYAFNFEAWIKYHVGSSR